MKKKLLLIVPMLHQGGYERVCITTARVLEPYYDVSIVIFNSADIAYNIEGLQIIDIKLGVQPGKMRKLLTILKRTWKVRKLKKDLQPEIAYSFGPTANMVNAFSKTKGTKVWLGLRNYTDIEERVKIRLFVKLADLIICCSKIIEEELHTKFHFKKTATLYNLYDVESIRKEAAQKEPELPWEDAKQGRDGHIPYLVSMGRDADQKGFWHLLKLFKEVLKEIPHARLLILGAGTFEEYRRLAEELDIAESIHFAGMQREPYKYLKKGSIYLLTSLNEGFPNALVEGMALGLAAVSVDCKTGPAEILLKDCLYKDKEEHFPGKESVTWGEYGILFPVMSARKDLEANHITQEEKNMAEGVIKLLSDRELLEKYQKAAMERAGIFSYENYVKGILKLAVIDIGRSDISVS